MHLKKRRPNWPDWFYKENVIFSLFTWCVPNTWIRPYSLTEERLQRKIFFFTNLWCKKSKIRGGEVPKMRRWNEEFITFWKKLKCQRTWRTQSDAGVAIDTTVSVDGQHAVSPTGPSRLSLSSIFFFNSRIVTLNPFQVRTLTTLSCFQSRKRSDYFVAGFSSEAQFQYFIYTDFLFCGCRPCLWYDH